MKRLLQISDVHLAGKLGPGGGALELDHTAQEEILQARLDALNQACDLGLQREVDLVCVPGDLFDTQMPPMKILLQTAAAFQKLRGIPAVIAPGNHDYWSSAGGYAREIGPGEGRWPPNVHIATEPGFSEVFQGVLAAAHTHHGLVEDNPFDGQQDGFAQGKILVFHGTLRGAAPPGKETTMGFTPADVARSGARWAAVGHLHSCVKIEDGGRPLGAYAGCPQGSAIDECGEKGVLIVDLDADPPKIEPVFLDGPRFWDISVGPISSSDGCVEAARKTIREKGARDKDFVRLTILGTQEVVESMDLPGPTEWGFRWVHVRARCIDEVPSAAGFTGDKTVLGEFARRVSDYDDEAAAQDAWRLGYLALKRGEVRPDALD